MITEYRILQDSDLCDLEEAVNSMIAERWQPLGGVSAVSYMSGPDRPGHGDDYWAVLYVQAMVRHGEKKSLAADRFEKCQCGHDRGVHLGVNGAGACMVVNCECKGFDCLPIDEPAVKGQDPGKIK